MMNMKFSNILIVIVTLAFAVMPVIASDQLIESLTGKIDAPVRSDEQLATDYQKAIDYLLPLMSGDDVSSRYQYQIMLQDMGSHASRPGAQNECEVLAAAMVNTLANKKMLPTVQNWFVLQLQRIDNGSSVPALAKLMKSEDRNLRDYARRALQWNPSEAATAALLAELKTTADNEMKIGLMYALLEKKCTEAVESLDSMEKPFNKLPLNTKGQMMIEMLLSDPESAEKHLTKIINDKDPKIRRLAVHAAYKSPDKKLTGILTDMLTDLSPENQKQVLGLIAKRGNYSSIAPVKELLNSPDQSVRLEAVNTLASLGCQESAIELIQIASSANDPCRKLAAKQLALMTGPDVTETIMAQASTGDTAKRSIAIALLAQRQVPDAGKILLGYAAEDDDIIKAAALKTLTAIAGPADLVAVVNLINKTSDKTAVNNGLDALKSILTAAKDKQTISKIYIDQINKAPVANQPALFSLLNILATDDALALLTKAVDSDNEAIKDSAIRTISKWSDYKAAKTLMAIAASAETSTTHHVLAIRGAINIAKSDTKSSAKDRIALCQTIIETARRDEEKNQAQAVLNEVKK
ncbi:MAG: HEAT repeat domain-containing protein [Phycisphaerae bacterium]|nr:HEAT repeat domain-containing protein [Phycisphaerae bacterium]